MNTIWTKLAVAVLLSITFATQHVRADEIEYSKSPQEDEVSVVDYAYFPDVTSASPELGATPITDTKNPKVEWSDVFSASGVAPLSIKAGAMDSSWRSFKLSNDWSETTASIYTGARTAFYSRGQVFTIRGEGYLVTYREERPTYDIRTSYSINNFPKAPAFTRDTVLRLSLLNLRTIGNMNDIKAFDAKVFPPSATSSTREGRELLRRQSANNLEQLGIAIKQYQQAHKMDLPPSSNMYAFKKAVTPYVKNENIFRQPGNKAFYVSDDLSKQTVATFVTASTVLVYEAQPDADGLRNVLFADGSVRAVNRNEWTRNRKELGIK